jgi:hypothetical protein
MNYWYDDIGYTSYYVEYSYDSESSSYIGAVISTEPYTQDAVEAAEARAARFESYRPLYESLALGTAAMADNNAWLEANPEADPFLRSLAEQNIVQAGALKFVVQPVLDQVEIDTHRQFEA